MAEGPNNSRGAFYQQTVVRVLPVSAKWARKMAHTAQLNPNKGVLGGSR